MKLMVSASPHITGSDTTQSIMRDVIIALLPALVASVRIYGMRTLLLVAVTVAACVFFEYIYEKSLKRPVTVSDLSAVVTGLLLAYNLPPEFPIWMAIVGAAASIVVVKQLFGGIGYNFANPAIAGRIILSLSYGSRMTKWVFPKSLRTPDVVAMATPLAQYANGAGTRPRLLDLFVGTVGGVIGETSALALLLGFIYLLVRKVISPVIPVTYIATVAVLARIAGLNPLVYILSGGLLLGAIFMATDYTTSPYTIKGKLIFGLGLGIITFMIRYFGTMAEGVSYAILLMNLLVPFINKSTKQKPLGAPLKKKEAK
jgi:electron transport complex protein RnfD